MSTVVGVGDDAARGQAAGAEGVVVTGAGVLVDAAAVGVGGVVRPPLVVRGRALGDVAGGEELLPPVELQGGEGGVVTRVGRPDVEGLAVVARPHDVALEVRAVALAAERGT